MCQGLSAVWDSRNKRLYSVSGVNSHQEIKKQLNLKDDDQFLDNLINLEALCRGCFTNLKDWFMKVDHDWVGQEWGIEEKEQAEKELMVFVEVELEQVKATGKYNGSLDLRNTPITSLGGLKSVGDSLHLSNTPIASLGGLESVGGGLNLANTPITSLGGLKSIGGYLDLANTPITSLGKCKVKGTVYGMK